MSGMASTGPYVHLLSNVYGLHALPATQPIVSKSNEVTEGDEYKYRVKIYGELLEVKLVS